MPVGAIAGAVGAVGNLVGGILGKNAANDAAKAQQQAAQQAAAYAKSQGADAISAQQQATQQQTQNVAPYTTAGAASVNRLNDMLGPNGSLSTNFAAFDPNSVNLTADPGYQFRLQQGNNALQNSALARGGLLTSGTAKNLLDYSQGAASQEYGDAFNRSLQTYNTNANNFYTGQNNAFNRNFSLSQLGQNSTLNMNNLLQTGATNTGNIDLTTANMVNQQTNNAAAAQASGIVGGTNALTAGIGGAANATAGTLMMPGLFGNGSTNSSGNNSFGNALLAGSGFGPQGNFWQQNGSTGYTPYSDELQAPVS
jgi:hypothetical protein